MITISPIGSQLVLDFLCLGDAGSGNMALFQADDLVALGVDGQYVGWGPLQHFNTANGIVIRRMVIMREILKSVSGVLMENWLVPGTSVGNIRLSGMVVRKSYFTATAPDGNGVLFVAVKKRGLWHICLLFDALIIMWMDKFGAGMYFMRPEAGCVDEFSRSEQST